MYSPCTLLPRIVFPGPRAHHSLCSFNSVYDTSGDPKKVGDLVPMEILALLFSVWRY